MKGKSKTFRLVVMALLVLLIAGGLALRMDQRIWGDSASFELAPADARSKQPYDLSSVAVLTRVMSFLTTSYYDPQRMNPKRMFLGGMDKLALNIPSVMVETVDGSDQIKVRVDTNEQTFPYGDLDSLMKVQYRVADIFRFIQPRLGLDTDPKEVEYAVVNGMLSTLDPHSVLLSPRQCKELETSTQGNFGGLGIQIGLREGKLTVLAPLKNTPASRAGIKSKDVIERIDGQSTVNMPLDEAVTLMRGPKGTKVRLTIMRKGWPAPKDFDLVRDNIPIESVYPKLLAGGIGYARVTGFNGNTHADLKAALRQMAGNGPLKGLILDLRNNPGGLFDAAIRLSDLFLLSGTIVTTVGAGNRPLDENEAVARDTEDGYPIVVLVSAYSASSSEILAGALKNNNRAVIVGDRTYGKGSVQVIHRIDDGSCLKATIAQYLTPGNLSIQSVGITPDIELTPVYIEEDRVDFFVSDKLHREKDLQSHLVHSSAVSQLPFETIRYLYDKSRDETEEDGPTDEFLMDFHVQMAHDLLRKVGLASERKMMLQRSVDFLKKLNQAEDAKIVQRFMTRKVDWTRYASSGPTTLDFSIGASVSGSQSVLKPVEANSATPVNIGVVEAGQDAAFTVKVQNTGSAPYVRLRVITDSDNAFLDGIEFFIGHLPAGQSREWTTKVSLPKSLVKRTDEVLFRFTEEGGSEIPSIKVLVETRPIPKPDFGFTFQIDDPDGNGDGLIQKGETITAHLDFINRGQGIVEKGVATIRNSDNIKEIFINAGRIEFEGLRPGERKNVTFFFQVKSDIGETVFPMEITLYDSETRTLLTQTFRLKISSPLPLQMQSDGTGVMLPSGTKIYGSPDESYPTLATLPNNETVPVLAVSSPWAKVALAEKRHGWVKLAQFTELGKTQAPTPKIPVSITSMPPVITVNSAGSDFVEGDQLMLTGIISDDNRVQDVYILRNGKKVFFKSNMNGSTPMEMDFSVVVPLQEGANHIVVVARESEGFYSRKSLEVYRKRTTTVPGQIDPNQEEFE